MANPATENLYLLEFLINDINLSDGKRCDCSSAGNELCVSFQFLDNQELQLCERDFDQEKIDMTMRKIGKSCIFSLTPQQAEAARQIFDINVSIYKKLPPEKAADDAIVGTTVISVAQLLTDLLELLSDTLCARLLEDEFTLEKHGKKVGSIDVFIRLSCYGKVIVTLFQMNMNDKTVLFKDKEGRSIYRYKKRKTDKTNKSDCLEPLYPSGDGDVVTGTGYSQSNEVNKNAYFYFEMHGGMGISEHYENKVSPPSYPVDCFPTPPSYPSYPPPSYPPYPPPSYLPYPPSSYPPFPQDCQSSPLDSSPDPPEFFSFRPISESADPMRRGLPSPGPGPYNFYAPCSQPMSRPSGPMCRSLSTATDGYSPFSEKSENAHMMYDDNANYSPHFCFQPVGQSTPFSEKDENALYTNTPYYDDNVNYPMYSDSQPTSRPACSTRRSLPTNDTSSVEGVCGCSGKKSKKRSSKSAGGKRGGCGGGCGK